MYLYERKKYFEFSNKEIFNSASVFFIWVKIFKNGQSKICGRQSLKNLKWYGLHKAGHNPFNFLKGCRPQILLGPFLLNTLSHIYPFCNVRNILTAIAREKNPQGIVAKFYSNIKQIQVKCLLLFTLKLSEKYVFFQCRGGGENKSLIKN